MSIDISSLLHELRYIKAVGRADDATSATVLYKGSTSLLLRYVSCRGAYTVFAIVRRTSRQYYKVIAVVNAFGKDIDVNNSFRNYRLTAEFIKNLIRR